MSGELLLSLPVSAGKAIGHEWQGKKTVFEEPVDDPQPGLQEEAADKRLDHQARPPCQQPSLKDIARLSKRILKEVHPCAALSGGN